MNTDGLKKAFAPASVTSELLEGGGAGVHLGNQLQRYSDHYLKQSVPTLFIITHFKDVLSFL